MFGKSLLVLGLSAFVVLGEDCKTFSGPRCPEKNEQTMLSSADCSRSCFEVYPLFTCDKLCDQFEGPNCTGNQHRVENSCDCTVRCVEVLGEGDKCDTKGNSMCEKPLNCVDGVCKS